MVFENKKMIMLNMIKYQQNIDDLVSWYINGILSNTLFSLNNVLSLIIGNLVT
jgi:hypothetical protein